ncbi:hypothetical protein NDU88_000371 [Pleurodeles waltl]|uniref:Uncharacterized protein n=1 Tax=Pleurodeles waltl TaxID=8319 RepID=A0AAV7VVX2_PLEWA|nr:hypothetical protein NDU88_000371 [Pleurodeles waltl]
MLQTRGIDRATEKEALPEALREVVPEETSGLGPGVTHKAVAAWGTEGRPGGGDLRTVLRVCRGPEVPEEPKDMWKARGQSVLSRGGGQGGRHFPFPSLFLPRPGARGAGPGEREH